MDLERLERLVTLGDPAAYEAWRRELERRDVWLCAGGKPSGATSAMNSIEQHINRPIGTTSVLFRQCSERMIEIQMTSGGMGWWVACGHILPDPDGSWCLYGLYADDLTHLTACSPFDGNRRAIEFARYCRQGKRNTTNSRRQCPLLPQ